MLQDHYGRQITYLRISVTDRCNLRCVYCLPPEGAAWQPHSSILRYEEITQVARAAAEQGVRALRLTGGEPLVRAGLTGLVRMLAAIPGIDDLSLTTNGLLLEKMAAPLAEAGLRRINISLDTLQPERYTRITRGGSLEQVWRGLEAAERCGLTPLKINAVAMRGVNAGELVDLARLSLERAWHIRFIELMPVSNQTAWGEGLPSPDQAYLSVHEMLEILRPLGLKPATAVAGNGPARFYALPGARGTVGFISPLGEHFCQSCNRLRLTADGNLRPCLLSDVEIPLLPALRAGEPVIPYLQKAVDLKPLCHKLESSPPPAQRCMQQIGG